ncbi:MAG: hypothetical protein K2Q09_10940, partial [Phycisphaerales bacterium]|nr:hypothetical protein [Phycisphaerales bacterium]
MSSAAKGTMIWQPLRLRRSMSVDASTPVPDELDARVEQMLQQIDRVHAEVVNRLDLRTDEDPAASEPDLDAGVQRALRDAAEAAGRVNRAAEAAADSAPVRPTGDDVPTATMKELDEQLAGAMGAAAVDD